PPFRAEHIGSLVRPSHLLHARSEVDAGRMDTSQLREIEDAAIRDAVKRQEELGLHVISDGEFRRGAYAESFTSSGISGLSMIVTDEDRGFHPDKNHGHRRVGVSLVLRIGFDGTGRPMPATLPSLNRSRTKPAR